MTVTTTIKASLLITLTCNKSQSLGDPTAGLVTVPQNLGNVAQTWDASTNPNGLDSWSGLVAMTAGTATIDLTALAQAGLSTTVNATGLKLRAIEVQASPGNAAPIEVQPGASNGYPSVGTISALGPGDIAVKTTSSAVAVDSTDKTITITGTGTDSCELLLVFGS